MKLSFLTFFLTFFTLSRSQCGVDELTVSLTACNGFTYFGSWNSFSMQVQGEDSETGWFIVNDDATLPSNGGSLTYCISEDFTNVGEFVWITIQAFESELFCIKELSVSYQTEAYTFDSEHFGEGVFLVDSCDFNYLWLSDNSPLLPCYDSSFILRTYQQRTIYNFDIHSCLRAEASTSVNALKQDISFGLLVQNFNDTAWVDGGNYRLDHFVPNAPSEGFDGKRIGHLAAIDYKLESDANDNDFTPPIDGELVGFRMVLKGTSVNAYGVSTILSGFDCDIWKAFAQIDICQVAVVQFNAGERYQYIRLKEEPSANNGDLLMQFANVDCLEFNSNGKCIDLIFITGSQGFQDLKRGQRMAVETVDADDTGTSPTRPDETDIYLIYTGYEDIYQIPYVRTDLTDDTGKDFFSADAECKNQYGTNLASISNDLSNSLSKIYCEYDTNCWIGAYQFSQVGVDDGYWRWTDNTGIFEGNSVSYWSPNEPNDNNDQEDCAHIYGEADETGGWNDIQCDTTIISNAICNSPFWYADQTRQFQLNIDDIFDQVVLMSISNSGDDPFCVDYISGVRQNTDHEDNAISVKIGPTNWVGTANTEVDDQTGEIITNICNFVECSQSMYAMFTLPVCEINIVETVVEDLDFGTIDYDEANVAGLSCNNQNRFITATCDVSQSLEIEETTSVEISHGTISGSENTWTVGVGIEVNIGSPAGNFPYVAVTGSFEYSSTSYSETENTRSEGFETSEAKSVECTGSIEVPPNHGIDYILTLSQETVTLETSNTLELVLCSAFIEEETTDALTEESGNVIYQYNVPGAVTTVTATICNVVFDTADRILSIDLPCGEMNALAVRTGATYMPLCQEDNIDLYDGCQCETGDKLTEAPCYCVDETTGAIIAGTAIFSEDDHWTDTCRLLACENSIYGPPPTSAPTLSPTGSPTYSPTGSPTDLTDNIALWEPDLTDFSNGILCLCNPDINNPYRICIELIALSETDELCHSNSNGNPPSSEKFDKWKDYDYSTSTYVLDEPPNANNSNIQVLEILVSKDNYFDIKIQFFYNRIITDFENGLTVGVEALNGWPFGLNDQKINTMTLEYNVYLEGNPNRELIHLNNADILSNTKEYYSEYFHNGFYSTNLVHPGLLYLLHSNKALYDNTISRVGVRYDGGHWDSSSSKHSSSHGIHSSSSSSTTSSETTLDDIIFYTRLCFHHFENTLDYDSIVDPNL